MSDVAVWGDFEIRFSQVLGRGGMGSVYKARQLSLDRWVAVKVLDTSRAPDPELAQGFLEKFHIESRALAKLQDPRIVTILQAGENDGRCWFAMELIEGRTAEQALGEDGAFKWKEAARVGCEVARALDAAFRQGITHRDVKPANIFLCRDGSVKLADFGLARSAEFTRTRITEANAIACTPDYASPEMVDGRPGDHRSDIYSLGCVLYELVTERTPFTGDSNMEILFKHTTEQPVNPRVLNPGIPTEFERVVLKCLQKDPAARYPDYTELIRDLEPPPAAPPRDWLWPAAAVAGAALFGIILTTIYAREPAPRVVTREVVRDREVPMPAPPPPPPPLEVLVKPAPPPPPLPPEPAFLDWLRGAALSHEEEVELDAFYDAGAAPALQMPIRVALEEARDHEPVSLEEALRRLEDEPETGLRLGGLVRRECAKIVAAMEHGEVREEPSFPAWVEPYARSAVARMRRERDAMRAPEPAVLRAYAGTWAFKRLVRRAYEEFQVGLELLPRDGWSFTRVDRPREDSSWKPKESVLEDPTSSSTIGRRLEHRGWRVEFEFRHARGAADPALFAIPGAIPRPLHYTLFRFRSKDFAVVRKTGAEVKELAVVPVAPADRHLLAFVPRGEMVLAYLDGALAHVEEMALEGAVRIGVQEGAARIHKVEVKR